MGIKFTPQQLELYQGIDQILREDWDPIGVYDVAEAKDEYHPYLPVVYKMVLDNSTAFQIAEYLAAACEAMGLSSTIDSNISVANKIISLKTEQRV